MKYLNAIAVVVLFLTANVLSAQSTTDWPQLKTFHEVMSRTFHPAEEDNLEPIKNWSETLTQKADDLTKTAIPKAFDNAKVKASVARLQQKSKEVHALVVAKASDAEIKKSLTEAHDIFHEIVGLCTEPKK